MNLFSFFYKSHTFWSIDRNNDMDIFQDLRSLIVNIFHKVFGVDYRMIIDHLV